jgi:hypothetical protein
VICCEQHWIGVRVQSVPFSVAPQLLAELGHEVRKFDKADMRTTPEVIVNLGYGRQPQAGIFKRIFDFLRRRAPRLDSE